MIALLNKAYCDELLAFYQYWIGAKLAVGIPRDHVQSELEEHAKEELDHADRLAKRIIELGGTPEIDPANWKQISSCGYDAPTDPCVEALLEQNIKGERCAIEVYKKLLDYVRGKDMITGHLVRHILEDELEHEHDLEDLVQDIEHFRKSCTKK